MKVLFSKKRDEALTLEEVLMVVAVVIVLVALALPRMARTRVHVSKANCVNNLKQIGLAFKVWSGDQTDRFPMQVPASLGGTKEYVEGTNAFIHFEVMSNELNTPWILFCPEESDPTRMQANTFTTSSPLPAGQVPFNGNSNLSYFVCVDAVDAFPNTFLAGDRNITNGFAIQNGLLTLMTNQLCGWTEKMHTNRGNICFADASVQILTTLQLRDALQQTGFSTNRLAMP